MRREDLTHIVVKREKLCLRAYEIHHVHVILSFGGVCKTLRSLISRYKRKKPGQSMSWAF